MSIRFFLFLFVLHVQRNISIGKEKIINETVCSLQLNLKRIKIDTNSTIHLVNAHIQITIEKSRNVFVYIFAFVRTHL